MFVSQGDGEEDDDDRRYDPAKFDDEDEMLGWDPQAVYVSPMSKHWSLPANDSKDAHEPAPMLQNSRPRRQSVQQEERGKGKAPSGTAQSRFAPTQRISQVRMTGINTGSMLILEGARFVR